MIYLPAGNNLILSVTLQYANGQDVVISNGEVGMLAEIVVNEETGTIIFELVQVNNN